MKPTNNQIWAKLGSPRPRTRACPSPSSSNRPTPGRSLLQISLMFPTSSWATEIGTPWRQSL